MTGLIALATVLAILGLACTFAWVSRMCGGGAPKLPWGLDQWVYAVPHGVLGFLCGSGWWHLLALLSYGFAFAGKRLGHGQWFDLGTTTKLLVDADGKPRVEALDFLVRALMGPDPNVIREGPGSYRRDYVGLAISGLFISLGSTIVLLGTGHLLYALATAMAGVSKPIGYAAGLWLTPRTHIHPNVYGELLAGFIDSAVVFLVISNLLNGG